MRLPVCTTLCIVGSVTAIAPELSRPVSDETLSVVELESISEPSQDVLLINLGPHSARLTMPDVDKADMPLTGDDATGSHEDNFPLPGKVEEKLPGSASQHSEADGDTDSVVVALNQSQKFSKTELCSTAARVAGANKLPVSFFINLIQQESGFRPHIVSSAGAQGIAQFMPEVAASKGVVNPFDPIESLSASGKFLAQLLDRFGNLGLAAAAYNAGSQRVRDWMSNRRQLPEETRHYVRIVTGIPAEAWVRKVSKARQIRLPPPAHCPEEMLQTKAGAADLVLLVSLPKRETRLSGLPVRPAAAIRSAQSTAVVNRSHSTPRRDVDGTTNGRLPITVASKAAIQRLSDRAKLAVGSRQNTATAQTRTALNIAQPSTRAIVDGATNGRLPITVASKAATQRPSDGAKTTVGSRQNTATAQTKTALNIAQPSTRAIVHGTTNGRGVPSTAVAQRPSDRAKLTVGSRQNTVTAQTKTTLNIAQLSPPLD